MRTEVTDDVLLPRSPDLEALDEDRELQGSSLEEVTVGVHALRRKLVTALVERQLGHCTRCRRSVHVRVHLDVRDVATEVLADREVALHLLLVVGVLHAEEHADRDALLQEHRLDQLAERHAARRTTLVTDAAPGYRREIVIARRVEHTNVCAGEARATGAGEHVHAADAARVDRNRDTTARLLAVTVIDLAHELLHLDVARACRLCLGVGTEVGDVCRQLIDEQVALLHDPLELIRVDEVPKRLPVGHTPFHLARLKGQTTRARGTPDRAACGVEAGEHIRRVRRRCARCRKWRHDVRVLRERERLAEGMEAETDGQHVDLEHAVLHEAGVDRVDTNHALRVLQNVDLVTERRGDFGVEQRDVGCPRHVLDNGNLGKADLEDRLCKVAARGLAQTDHTAMGVCAFNHFHFLILSSNLSPKADTSLLCVLIRLGRP